MYYSQRLIFDNEVYSLTQTLNSKGLLTSLLDLNWHRVIGKPLYNDGVFPV